MAVFSLTEYNWNFLENLLNIDSQIKGTCCGKIRILFTPQNRKILQKEFSIQFSLIEYFKKS